ncbi:MAG: hypothetical protein SGILL_000779 [Bacillariaceae sp.]
MFGRSNSSNARTRSMSSRSSHGNSMMSGYSFSKRSSIDYDELVALYDITRADVQQFGTRKFRQLCKKEGPDVAARRVEQHVRGARMEVLEDIPINDNLVLEEADVWMNDDEVEVVLGATF